jgi:hypothetical protein
MSSPPRNANLAGGMERLKLTPRDDRGQNRVRITGLNNSKELNGREGVVKSEDSTTERLIIVLDDGGNDNGRLVKVQNPETESRNQARFATPCAHAVVHDRFAEKISWPYAEDAEERQSLRKGAQRSHGIEGRASTCGQSARRTSAGRELALLWSAVAACGERRAWTRAAIPGSENPGETQPLRPPSAARVQVMLAFAEACS